MSGVVVNGVQWERCNQCGGWENINLLAYAPLNPDLPIPEWATAGHHENPLTMKVDLCRDCVAGKTWTGKFRE